MKDAMMAKATSTLEMTTDTSFVPSVANRDKYSLPSGGLFKY